MDELHITKQLELIRERNARVEADKAWEQSWARRVCIGFITYITSASWLFLIDDNYPLLKAFVPLAGYILSTLTLPPLKKWWMNNKFYET